MRGRYSWILVAVSLLLPSGRALCGSIASQTYRNCIWSGGCGLNCLQMQFPIQIPADLSPTNVDSVWVEMWGTSHLGSQTICLGADCQTVRCADSVLASLQPTFPETSCDLFYFHPDGVADYVAGAYRPEGDGVSFVATCHLRGIERSSCCWNSFAVTDPYPSFEDLFAGDHVNLRVQRVHGGPAGSSGGCYKCNNGLAAIDSVRVNIAYGGALATESLRWGTLKALFR